MTSAELRMDAGGDADWPVARLVGEVDLSNVDDLTLAVESAVRNTAMGLVLDLSDVTYFDSTGLRLVFQLARELRDRQQELRLVVPPESRIWTVLRLAGVASVIRISAERAEALLPSEEAS